MTYELEIDTNANGGSRREPHVESYAAESDARAAYADISLADCEAWGQTAYGEWCVSLTRCTPTMDDDGLVLAVERETLAVRVVSL